MIIRRGRGAALAASVLLLALTPAPVDSRSSSFTQRGVLRVDTETEAPYACRGDRREAAIASARWDITDGPGTPDGNGDGDGVGDACDNCPLDPNPDPTDSATLPETALRR